MKTQLSQRIFTLFTVLLLLNACITNVPDSRSSSRTTDTHSNELATEAEQIAFLEQYINLKSAVTETEFHIVYQDNSGGMVAGPSDWEIQAVMYVADVEPWANDKTHSEPFDLAWADQLYADNIRPNSQPLFYQGSGTQLAIFVPERIVLFYSSTLSQ